MRAPKSSRNSSVASRRETRFLTDSVAIAASSRGPKAPAGTSGGSSARVVRPQSGQRRRWSRCSLRMTAIGGSSATWWRACLPTGRRSASLKRWPQAQRSGHWSKSSSTAASGRSRRPCPTMARLGSLATLRRRRPPALRRPRRILAGRHRGVARVAVQALLELRDSRRQLGDLRILCGKPRRQRQEHSHDGLASLLVDRLRLGPLHSAQFSRAGGVPSDLQQVEACHFAADGPRARGTERLHLLWASHVSITCDSLRQQRNRAVLPHITAVVNLSVTSSPFTLESAGSSTCFGGRTATLPARDGCTGRPSRTSLA